MILVYPPFFFEQEVFIRVSNFFCIFQSSYIIPLSFVFFSSERNRGIGVKKDARGILLYSVEFDTMWALMIIEST